jgi:histone H4
MSAAATTTGSRPNKGGKGVISRPAKRNRTLKRPLKGITKPAMKRCAHRAGALRVVGAMYEPVRAIVRAFVGILVEDSYIIAQYSGRITVIAEDAKRALANNDMPLYG